MFAAKAKLRKKVHTMLMTEMDSRILQLKQQTKNKYTIANYINYINLRVYVSYVLQPQQN